MINFQKLRYFCAMVEEGGIHKAARLLGLSQPPLSMALRELEEEVGCQLIFRSGRSWVVTDAGQRLYEEGKAILARMDGLGTRVARPSGEATGIVRAGFSTSCVSMFQKILPVMAAENPGISCHALFSDSERLARYVQQRLIDLAVLYLPLLGDDFEIQPLNPQRLLAVFSPLLPKPPRGEISLADVCKWPLLLPRRWQGGGIFEIFSRACQRLGLKAHIICQSQDSYLLRDLLESIPAVAITPQCEAENMKIHEERLIAELAEPLIPAIVHLKNTWLSNQAKQTAELIQKCFGTAGA